MVQWIPDEQTEEMIEAGCEAVHLESDRPGFSNRSIVTAAYKGALAVAPSPWQPIETVPKDGTSILLCDASVSGGCFVAEWDDEPLKPGWNWSLDDLDYHKDLPTHWMPLPSQPLPKQNKKEG